MKCQEAEALVMRYINNTLSLKELEPFLKHIEECPNCRDELETYYIVEKALEQLDNEEDDSPLNIKHLLEEDIQDKEEQIRRSKYMRPIAGFVTGAAIILLLGMIFLLGSDLLGAFR